MALRGSPFRPQRAIWFRFLALLAALNACTFAVGIAILRAESARRNYADLERRVTLTIVNLAQTATVLVRSGSWNELQRVVENVGASRLIYRLRVVSAKDGRVLASSDPLELGVAVDSPLLRRLFWDQALIAVTPFEDYERGFEAAVPVAGAFFDEATASDTAAAIWYVAEIQEERREARRTMSYFLAQSLASLLVVLCLTLVLLRALVTRPIAVFAAATERVRAGDYSVRMAVPRTDEFERFASLYNEMISEIGRKAEALRLANETLERRVEERTASLLRANGELEAARDRLVAQEKLAMAGKIAAGLAHEINNPIGFIGSNLSTLSRYLLEMEPALAPPAAPPGAPAGEGPADSPRQGPDLPWLLEDSRALIAESKQGIERIARIVDALRAYETRGAEEPVPIDLREVVEVALDALSPPFPPGVRVDAEYAEGTRVEASFQELVRVVVYLLANARDAVGGEGRVRVAVLDEGAHSLISISDSGGGIAPADLGRIFDPFFTTKEPGKGLGLGLGAARGIAVRYGGEIEVRNDYGRGVDFRLRLPAAGAEAGPEGGGG